MDLYSKLCGLCVSVRHYDSDGKPKGEWLDHLNRFNINASRLNLPIEHLESGYWVYHWLKHIDKRYNPQSSVTMFEADGTIRCWDKLTKKEKQYAEMFMKEREQGMTIADELNELDTIVKSLKSES